MTKQASRVQATDDRRTPFGHWSLVIGHSFVIRISSFVIPAFCLAAGPTTRPATAPATVEQRIDQLLAERPLPPRRPPPLVHGRVPKPTPYVREGTTLEHRLARLGHTADGLAAVLTFLPDGPDAPPLPPMVVLQNLQLDAMERAQRATAHGGPATFRVDGLVTEYKGRNYLRVDRATADGDDRALPVSPSAGRADPPAVAPGASPVRLVRDGTHFTRRTGRLNLTGNPSGDGAPGTYTATLTFDADAKTMRDPPLTILPNLKLANMEGQRAGLHEDVKFRCSGTLTEYHGRNYVLLDDAVATSDFDDDR